MLPDSETEINMDFQIGFIGLGLIGGSIARGIKKINMESLSKDSIFYGKSFRLTAYNYHKGKNPTLEAALRDGNIDVITDRLSDLGEMDLIILCAPVISNINYLRELKDIISPKCILTDVGSVKNDIQKAVDELGLSSHFIGGHPMAGAEHSGYENSSESILCGSYYILTPTKDTVPSAINLMSELIRELHSIEFTLNPKEHDVLVASISHLPHLIAASLVDLVSEKDKKDNMKQLAAGGFKDITRIASSSAVMWRDVCMSNTESILFMLREYMKHLKDIEKSLEDKDAQYIYELFVRSKSYRDNIPDR